MDKRIERTERDCDGFWIYLKPGFSRQGEHTIVENTRKAAFANMGSVTPCGCGSCKYEIALNALKRDIHNA